MALRGVQLAQSIPIHASVGLGYINSPIRWGVAGMLYITIINPANTEDERLSEVGREDLDLVNG